jgi:hypothetical protein
MQRGDKGAPGLARFLRFLPLSVRRFVSLVHSVTLTPHAPRRHILAHTHTHTHTRTRTYTHARARASWCWCGMMHLYHGMTMFIVIAA